MSKLDYEERKEMPEKEFVFPKERKYPIENESHARNALARVSAFGTPEEKEKVREAVHRKYPDIGKEKKKSDDLTIPSLTVKEVFEKLTGKPIVTEGTITISEYPNNPNPK